MSHEPTAAARPAYGRPVTVPAPSAGEAYTRERAQAGAPRRARPRARITQVLATELSRLSGKARDRLAVKIAETDRRIAGGQPAGAVDKACDALRAELTRIAGRPGGAALAEELQYQASSRLLKLAVHAVLAYEALPTPGEGS